MQPRPHSRRAEAGAAQTAGRVATQLAQVEPPSAAAADAILARVRERQRAVGYGGNLAAWLEKVTPAESR